MFKTNTMSKLWLTLAIMVVSVVNAVADNVISISGFDILPGEKQELSVNLDNTDPVCVLQFELALPAGLSIVGDEVNDYFQKTARDLRHQMTVTKKAVGEKYQVLIYSAAMREIAPGEGAIATFTVKANDSYNPITASTIVIDNVTGSNKSGQDIVSGNGEVVNEQGHFTLSADPVEAVENAVTEVTLNLHNQLPISHMQARIVVPEGMEIVPEIVQESDGLKYYYFAPANRTENHEVAGNKLGTNEYTLLVTSATNVKVKGTEGAVVKFNVKCSKVMENALIHVTDVVCSWPKNLETNVPVKVDDLDIVVNVTPAQVIFFEDAQDIIKNAGDKYAFVKLDDAANKAKIDAEVADLNAAVIAGEMTREEALAELEKVIKNMEQATGDVNLDGEFDVDDAQALFNAVLGTGNTEHLYDSNADGDIDVDDAQYLFNKSLGL